MQKLCQTCSSPLLGRFQTKFCSKSCAASYNNVGVTRHFKNPKHECKQCGTLTRNQYFCSLSCKNEAQRKHHGDEAKALSLARHNEAWHRYQARKLNQTPLDADLKLIQQFYVNCPDGYEVDHIVPISKGGLHHQGNLQYLTIQENRRKSNKLP